MASVGPIASFINTHYDVVFAGEEVNRETFENVDEFLLGFEKTLSHRIINSFFVNTFAHEDDLVLMQNDDYDIPLSHRDFYQLLTTPARKEGYASEVKYDRLNTRINHLVADSNLIERAFYQTTCPEEKYRLAVKIYALSRLKTMYNLTNHVAVCLTKQRESVTLNQDAILITLEKVKATGKYKFFHVDSFMIYQPSNPITFETSEHARAQAQASIESAYPSFLYTRFHQTLNKRKLVILAPKTDVAMEIETPRIAEIRDWIKKVIENIHSGDVETSELLTGNEHFQEYGFLLDAHQPDVLTGRPSLPDPHSRIQQEAAIRESFYRC